MHAQDRREFGFTKPVHLPFNLAGSFGEPRPDHFHSGIDIKTNGVEGEPVFSIGDGYISRIRVSPYGYGKAIYITHPNGYTSVYGHLSKFNSAIEKYVHEKHYETKSSELDLTLTASIFPVKQNDTIAFSGNTGGSTAPHLHFEIRETKTEHALNALDFYPKNFYVDTIPPQINKIKVYEFDKNFYSGYTTTYNLRKMDSIFVPENFISISSPANFCFSLEGFDKQDRSENKNGIQRIEIFQNNRLVFKYDLNQIDFDKTRMCNAFVDYDEMMNDHGYYYNCYRLKNNTLSYYDASDGFFHLNDSDTSDWRAYCYDHNSNKTVINFKVTGKARPKINDTVYTELVTKHILEDATYTLGNKIFNVSINPKTFYDDVDLIYGASNDRYQLYNPAIRIPLQKAAKLAIECNNKICNKMDPGKAVLVLREDDGKETSLNTTFEKNRFLADTRKLGTFFLKYDTVKPLISILNFNSENHLFSNRKIRVHITDDLSGISVYNGYIDEQWVNFYYDSKNDVIEYNFDEYGPPGEHLLKIVVTDKKKNEAIAIQKFIAK